MAPGIMRKAMVFLGLDDEEYDDVDYDDAPVAAQPPRRYQEPTMDPMERVGPADRMDRQPSGIRAIPRDAPDPSGPMAVTPRPLVRPIPAAPSVRVHVVTPQRFSDVTEVGDQFKSGQPVIVNLSESGDRDLARRMVDFCSGVAYALSGSMDKVAYQVFLLTPNDVEVPAEEKRRLQEQGLYRS